MEAGVLAVALAAAAMLIDIWIRFEWQFAVGAIATLILDITKTLGSSAITGMDFNLTAIAALLTLIGYSVNDKVVVYDRMRENLRLFKKMPLRELIDLSINATLARSIFTWQLPSFRCSRWRWPAAAPSTISGSQWCSASSSAPAHRFSSQRLSY